MGDLSNPDSSERYVPSGTLHETAGRVEGKEKKLARTIRPQMPTLAFTRSRRVSTRKATEEAGKEREARESAQHRRQRCLLPAADAYRPERPHTWPGDFSTRGIPHGHRFPAGRPSVMMAKSGSWEYSLVSYTICVLTEATLKRQTVQSLFPNPNAGSFRNRSLTS